MSDSSDPNRKKRMFQDAQQSGPSGPGWTPLSAAAVNSTFAGSSDFTQYEIIDLLGHGGMGAVYRARDTKTSREVAIKLLRHDALHDDAFVARFKKESHNLRRVNHHNVVRVFDEGEVEGYPFFVMELLEGHTLASEIERSGRMPLADIRRIMGDICAGLEAVHKEGLVHRDLKAANIFLANDGRVVILDFGLARDVTAKPSTLSVAGSEGHIAPEVLKGEPATQLSDIFSGGVIYLHLLTGTIPRGGQVQLHETYGLDPRLDEIVKKACNENPKGRYQSAKDFAEALEAAMSLVPPRPVELVPLPLHRDNPPASPAPVKTKEKTDDAGSSTSTAPTPKDINDELSARRLQEHLDYLLIQWKPSKPPKTRQSTPISEDEDWEVIDQWNAFPEIPPFEEVKRKVKLRFKLSWMGIGWLFDRWMMLTTGMWNWHATTLIAGYWNKHVRPGEFDPHQMFWHPREPYLFVSRDHRHITGWYWEKKKSANEKSGDSHVRISDAQGLFSAGYIDKMFFSDTSNSDFLLKSESFWWWGATLPNRWIFYNSRGESQSMISADWRVLSVFGDLRSNPLRPLRGEILAFPSSGLLSLCQDSMFPKNLYFPAYDLSKLQEFAKMTINLAKLQLSEEESVGSFAWHPSGFYLALEISGRLALLHWDFAELVRYPELLSEQKSEKYEAVAWSPDGTLLAVDREISKVWDIHTNEIRPLAPHERWDYRPAGSLDNQLKSCDGLRSFSSHQGGPNFPIKNWEEVTDIAWSPDDPDIFATVGGKDCPRDIRIWQRVK